LAEFSWTCEARGIRHVYCRDCMRSYMREHYLRNKETYIRHAKMNSARYTEINRRRCWEYLSEHPCIDCGESDPMVLEFDHRERAHKRIAVSLLLRAGPWRNVLSEIRKCDVRCANCHRRRTAIQLSWSKTQFQSDM
jgi:hypothetical protein